MGSTLSLSENRFLLALLLGILFMLSLGSCSSTAKLAATTLRRADPRATPEMQPITFQHQRHDDPRIKREEPYIRTRRERAVTATR